MNEKQKIAPMGDETSFETKTYTAHHRYTFIENTYHYGKETGTDQGKQRVQGKE